jgi:hypothetical protein
LPLCIFYEFWHFAIFMFVNAQEKKSSPKALSHAPLSHSAHLTLTPMASRFAKRRASQQHSLQQRLLSSAVPSLQLPHQQHNHALALAFATSQLQNHRFLSVNAQRVESQIEALALSFTVNALPQHAAAVRYLAKRIAVLYDAILQAPQVRCLPFLPTSTHNPLPPPSQQAAAGGAGCGSQRAELPAGDGRSARVPRPVRHGHYGAHAGAAGAAGAPAAVAGGAR